MKKLLIEVALVVVFITVVGSFHNSWSQLPPAIKSPSVNMQEILQSKIPLVEVEYQSDSMVVLRGDEGSFVSVNGTMTPFWNAIDIVKGYGYSLNEVTTSGAGSQGNPTRFYAIMTKP